MSWMIILTFNCVVTCFFELRCYRRLSQPSSMWTFGRILHRSSLFKECLQILANNSNLLSLIMVIFWALFVMDSENHFFIVLFLGLKFFCSISHTKKIVPPSFLTFLSFRLNNKNNKWQVCSLMTSKGRNLKN